MVEAFYDSRLRPIVNVVRAVGWDGRIGPQCAESSKLLAGRCPVGPLALPTVARLATLVIKANEQFDMLMMPGEEHGGGRRGASAPYGDRKVWDFFVTNLLGAKITTS